MPTALPRLQITMPQELYDAVTDLSELTCQSKARVLLDVLEPATPFFQEIAKLIRAQKEIKEEPTRQLQANLDAVMQRMTSGLPMSNRALILMAELVQEMKEAEASEVGEAQSPRPVTRGPKSIPPPLPLSLFSSPSSL